MLANHKKHASKYFIHCASVISVYIETGITPDELFEFMQSCKNLKIGIAINPDTSAEKVFDFLYSDLDLILVMSVHPGYSGQKFIPEVISKIKFLKHRLTEMGLPTKISIVGGISPYDPKPSSVAQAIKAEADILVAGSVIFDSEDIAKTMRHLKNIGAD